MVALARAEERLVSMEEKHNHQYERLNRLSEKLDCIERMVQDNNRTVGLINKVAGAALLAAVGAFAAQYFG